MGVISILLGIIAFIGFTGAGAVLGNVYIQSFKALGQTFVSMQSSVSDTTIMIAFIGVFGFIGLLICITMVMQGLTYNKVCKIQKRVKHM